MTKTLFEYCTSTVLGSPYLLERVSLYLPRGISYFLLYIALETRNQLAVRKIVEKWPHKYLTLDFLSESSLCMRHRANMPHCLEPHEYMHVFGSYTRHSSYEMVSSLLEGVFYNLYCCTDEHVGLCVFDMSSVILGVHQIPLLLNLVNGRVPVTHLCDYISDKEAQKLHISRPHLKNCAVPHSSPLTLYVNILLDHRTSKQTIDSLVEICSHCKWVDVKLRGINVFDVRSALLEKYRAVFDTLISPVVEHMYLTEWCFGGGNEWHTMTYNERFSLWVSNSATQDSELLIMKIPVGCKNLLISTYRRSPALTKTLTELTRNSRTLRAFCLMRHNTDISQHLSTALDNFLVSVSENLEYLQLRCWSFTSTDFSSLQQCLKLRVLSVTEDYWSSALNSPKHSVSDILTALSQLPHLEFIQWSENLNLTTYGLFCLYNLLNNSFNSLQHFHVRFQFLILSTTDLENEAYTVMTSVLQPILCGLEGCESCTSFIFHFEKIHSTLSKWLSALRPEVCFRLCKEVSQAIELLRAVQCTLMYVP